MVVIVLLLTLVAWWRTGIWNSSAWRCR